MTDDPKRTLSNRIAARAFPHRFLAAQLRRPTGRFGRWILTRALNDGNAELIAATLEALLAVGFGQRRKMIRNTLGKWLAARHPALRASLNTAISSTRP